jgi:predicted ATPase/class 3 adenylate cyclase/Flp pilus assembly protein TadD
MVRLTKTFLLTDVEKSTQLSEQHGSAIDPVRRRHVEIIRQAVEAKGGTLYKTVGDGTQSAFDSASSALSAAIEAQLAHQNEVVSIALHSRMALHTCQADYDEAEDDYSGVAFNRAARLLSAGHGGQILISHATYEQLRYYLPANVTLEDLGEHRLKDLTDPEHIFQAIYPDLPHDFPELITVDKWPNNLPAQSTSLIGREKELADLRELLQRDDVRLITLTGPGGTGKTRLALQLAADLLDDFADGIWFVDLATIVGPDPDLTTDLVISAIAQTLGVKEAGSRPLVDTLKAYLKLKHILLLLDNFEHLLLAVPTVSQLLSATRNLKILSTSRAALHIYGEREFHVQPMALPSLSHDPQIGPDELPTLAQFDAVRFFVERASAVRPGFQATQRNIADIIEICRRLDGLPLAIELAAARIRILSTQALLERLSASLALLTESPRDQPLRQGTLRNTLDWSYNLLNDDEKALFRRLSVFAGGCTLDAAERLASGSRDLPPLQAAHLDLVSSLADKSLLRISLDASGEHEDAEPRIMMLQTVRDYAIDTLRAHNETEQTLALHLAYFITFAERAEVHLRGPEQQEWLQLLDKEHDNLRVALVWSKENDTEVFVRLAGAMRGFWNALGYLSEGQNWLDAALPLSEVAPLAVQSKVRHGAALMATDRGDYARATTLLRDNIEFFRRSGELGWLAHELNLLGVVASHKGDYVQASSLLKEGLDLRYMLGSTEDVAGSLNNLAHLSTLRDDYEQANSLLAESLKIVRSRGDRRVEAIVLNNLGYVAHRQGNLEAAVTLYRQSLDIKQQLGDKAGMASSLSKLAEIAYSQRQSDEARSLYIQSLTLCSEAGDLQSTLAPLVGLAELDRAGGNLHNAARLLALTSTLLETTGATLDPTAQVTFTRTQEQVRAQLPEATLKAASDQGKTLTLQKLVAEINRHPL